MNKTEPSYQFPYAGSFIPGAWTVRPTYVPFKTPFPELPKLPVCDACGKFTCTTYHTILHAYCQKCFVTLYPQFPTLMEIKDYFQDDLESIDYHWGL